MLKKVCIVFLSLCIAATVTFGLSAYQSTCVEGPRTAMCDLPFGRVSD